METVTGIFDSRQSAEQAFSALSARPFFNRDNLFLLTPDEAVSKIERVPTEDGEQPGMGSAIGGVVGGAVGLAAGVVLSNIILPGIGPILTLTLSAGGGLGGAALGAAGGSAAERALSNGLPKDEMFFYEQALQRHGSLVIALADSDEAAESARSIMQRSEAESIDAAREKWWIGLREAEAAVYDGRDFAAEENIYRAGFETALRPGMRNKSFDDAASDLRARCPEIWNNETFRRGFERGRRYLGSFQKNNQTNVETRTVSYK